MDRPLILLTNDDGIDSPGLAAMAAAVAPLAELLIVAPRWQQTGMGRSHTQRHGLDGRIAPQQICHDGQEWPAFAANATPASCVLFAVHEMAPRPIDLVISGINYGENIGNSVTMSGTIGAALEAAQLGLPALAISLELANTGDYHTYLDGIDFATAAHFTAVFTRAVLGQSLPEDVDVLKIEVPDTADANTPWVLTRQDRFNYYDACPAARSDRSAEPGAFDLTVAKGRYNAQGTDAHALARGLVAVTPLSFDMTSRVPLAELAALLSNKNQENH